MLKTSVCLAFCVVSAAWGGIVETSSVACQAGGQQVTDTNRCEVVYNGLHDSVYAYTDSNYSITYNYLSAFISTVAGTQYFSVDTPPSISRTASADKSLYIHVATDGEQRQGWALVTLTQSWYGQGTGLDGSRSYSASIDGLTVPIQSGRGTPQPSLVPILLGTGFGVDLAAHTDTFQTPYAWWSQVVTVDLKLYEDEAMTTPVPMHLAPEPGTWLLMAAGLIAVVSRKTIARRGRLTI